MKKKQKEKMNKESLIKTRIILTGILTKSCKMFITSLLLLAGVFLLGGSFYPQIVDFIVTITVILTSFLTGWLLGVLLIYNYFWEKIEFFGEKENDD